MFTHRHYVPILKSMEAEFVALRQMPNNLKKHLTPLFNILPPKMNHEKNKPKKSLDAHLSDLGIKISKNWGIDYPVFIDPSLIASGDYDNIRGLNPYVYFWKLSRYQYVKIVPVVSLLNNENYLNAVNETVAEDGNGICLRIIQEDIDNADSLEQTIDELLTRLKVPIEKTDIVLDFKSLPLQDVGEPLSYIRNVINTFPRISAWRTFTIAASNIPQSLRDMEEGSNALIPREEFMIWSNIISKGRLLSRQPAFGDYAIDHPTYRDRKFGKGVKICATLRYTTNSHWLVFKKRDINEYKRDQFYDICQELVAKKELFADPSFSEGDKRIFLCSKKSVNSPGGPLQWKQIGFNHHFTLVTHQVVNFRAST